VLANALAQTQALMVGKASDDGHRHFPGNRPSTLILLDALTPTTLGALIALQEHRVFVSGSLWGINSFDQWGWNWARYWPRTWKRAGTAATWQALMVQPPGCCNVAHPCGVRQRAAQSAAKEVHR
jgi:hypothetical protein